MKDTLESLTVMILEHQTVVSHYAELQVLPYSEIIKVNDRLNDHVVQALKDQIITREQSAFFLDQLQKIREQIPT